MFNHCDVVKNMFKSMNTENSDVEDIICSEIKECITMRDEGSCVLNHQQADCIIKTMCTD